MASIYVGNLSDSTSEDDLREAFAQYGKVLTVSIVKERERAAPAVSRSLTWPTARKRPARSRS